MTKNKYPQIIKAVTKNSAELNGKDFAGTIENWLQCRQERMQAQFRLLESCRTVEEIDRFKAEGLFCLKGTSI